MPVTQRPPRRRALPPAQKVPGGLALRALGIGVLLAGCGEYVSLGSECKDGPGACGPVVQPEPVTADASNEDASQLDDAALPPPLEEDPGPDASEPPPPLPLVLENPQLERNGGIDGDLILHEIFEALFETLVPMQPIFTSLPGWYSCVPFTVTSDSPVDERATYGNFISFHRSPLTPVTPEFSAARQMLGKPLRGGSEVLLLVDVLSVTEGDNNLFLQVRGDPTQHPNPFSQCSSAGNPLGRSPLIADSSDFRPVCIRFAADQDYYTLYLGPWREGTSRASTPNTPKLLIDNIRVVRECPVDALQ